MGAVVLVSLHPLTLSPLHHHHHHPPSSITPKSTFSILSPQPPSLNSLLISSKSFTARSSNSRENRPDVSSFLDEDGSVDDMDGYLNYLSLEYDSVWDTKPSWCQPWTILLTGITVVACSWLFLHSIIISAGVLFVISAWWYIFLYAYPKVVIQPSW